MSTETISLPVFSEADLAIIKDMVKVHKARRLNPPLNVDDDQFESADIYVARPVDPEDGIPGLVPAGTFQDDAGNNLPVLDEPGVALCEIYQFVEGRESRNEKQVLGVSGTLTGGTFDLVFDGDAVTVNFDDDAGDIQTALEGLVSIGAGNVSVTGGTISDTITVEFIGDYENLEVTQITLNIDNLAGTDLEKTETTLQDGGTSFYRGMQFTGLTEEVYNVSQSPLIEDYITIKRDKYGDWYATGIEDSFEGVLLNWLDPATGPLTGATLGLMVVIQRNYPISEDTSEFTSSKIIRGFYNRAISMQGAPGTYGRCKRMNGETRLEYLDCVPSEEGVQVIVEYEDTLVAGGFGSGGYGDGTFGG